jgi:hypothetical protein
VLDESAKKSANSEWRDAHGNEIWTMFAGLALHLVSCGVSESDAEHVLFMQTKTIGVQKTRFGLERRKRD